jgi:putative FmdB family regulatory protein
MPTYEYICENCGHELERFQSIKSRPLRKCPECGEKKLKRLLGTGSGVIFKGSGFYQTDYRSESYKKAAKKDKDSSKAKSKDEDKSSTEKAKAGGKDKKKTA